MLRTCTLLHFSRDCLSIAPVERNYFHSWGLHASSTGTVYSAVIVIVSCYISLFSIPDVCLMSLDYMQPDSFVQGRGLTSSVATLVCLLERLTA